MLAGIVGLALKQRLIVFIAAIALAVWGTIAYQKLSIDAFPDVAPIQVLVSMQAPGLTPEELESRVTTPIELAARGIPKSRAYAIDDTILGRAPDLRVCRRDRYLLGPRAGQ